MITDDGSEKSGFLLGFFLGLAGLIIALCLDKPATKSGAIKGFVACLIISILAAIIIGCSAASAVSYF